MNKRALLFVVALPICYMAFWLASLEASVTLAKEITLEVEGYDPRDLLSGHYLRYRVSYGDVANKGLTYNYSSDSCLCFGVEPTVPAKAIWAGNCSERDQSTCGIYLRGHTGWGPQFIADIERYYIPEQYASSLQRVPSNTTIRVAVPSSGRGIVRGMYVDGGDILEWAKSRQ